MAREYVVNGEHFPTQKALLERLRSILYSYRDGQAVSYDDMRFLYALVDSYHPSSELKIGIGVARIEVRRNPVYKNNRGFWIVRTDGTDTDFSFMECLRPSSKLDKFRSACRNAVAPIVAQYKAGWWTAAREALCPITGQVMTFADSHVHHAGEWTFDKIVESFLEERHIDLDAVKLTGSKDGHIGDYFEDARDEYSFVMFHNERADLQVVSAYGNLSVAKKGDNGDGQLSLFGGNDG